MLFLLNRLVVFHFGVCRISYDALVYLKIHSSYIHTPNGKYVLHKK